jgi:hypothetical protein
MTSIITLKQWFDQLLSSVEPTPMSDFDFPVRVGCVKMASPRDARFSEVLGVGMPLIDAVFNRTPFKVEHLSFVFPERYMSVHEQQGFMRALLQNPSIENIKSLDIITSSPLMVGDFKKEQIAIITWHDDYKYSGNPQFHA